MVENISDTEAGLSDVSSLDPEEKEEAVRNRPKENVSRWLGRAQMKARHEARQEAQRKNLEEITKQEEERKEREREAELARETAPPREEESDAGSGFSDVSGDEAGPPAGKGTDVAAAVDGPEIVPATDSDEEAVVAESQGPLPGQTRSGTTLPPAAPGVSGESPDLGGSGTEDIGDEVIENFGGPSPKVVSSNDDCNRVQMMIEASGSGDKPARCVVVRLRPDWAPTGAARFAELVEAGFYHGTRFHRVVNGALAQFGLPTDPALYSQWKSRRLQDDDVKQTVLPRGALAFAEKGEHARCCQVFLNLGHNKIFDRQGFTPFAEVVTGMDVLDELCTGYGEIPPKGRGPDPERIKEEGLTYLQSKFPELSWISEAKVLSRTGDIDLHFRRPSLKTSKSREAPFGSERSDKTLQRKVSYSDDPPDPKSPAGTGFKAVKALKC